MPDKSRTGVVEPQRKIRHRPRFGFGFHFAGPVDGVLRTRQTLQILGSRAHDADAVIRARPARRVLQALIQARFRIGPAWAPEEMPDLCAFVRG